MITDNINCLPDFLCKCVPFCFCIHHFFHNHFFLLNPRQRVIPCGTGILWNSLSIVYPVNIHFRSTICTIHQSSQRMCFSPSIRVSSYIASDPLDVIKGFLIYDRLLCVLEYCPLIFPYIMAFLILEMLSGFEVHCMTKVLPLLQNPCNSGGTPSIRAFDFIHPAFP